MIEFLILNITSNKNLIKLESIWNYDTDTDNKNIIYSHLQP